METFSFAVLQPVATRLGHPQLGGFKLQIPVTGSPTLRQALEDAGHSDLIQALEDEQLSRMCAFVVKGQVNHARLNLTVQAGDQVYILPAYSGG